MQNCTLVHSAVAWFSRNTHKKMRMGINPSSAIPPSVLSRLRLPPRQRWAVQLLAIFLLPAFQSMPRNDDILTLYPRASREPTKLQCFEWTDIKKRHIQFSFCCDHTIEWCLFNLFWVYLRTVNVLFCFDICFILLWKLKPKFFRQLSSFLKNPCPFLRVTKNISFQNTFLAHLIF